MRLIDADALPMHKVKIVHAFGIVEGCVVFPDTIAKAPTIDAVPVVRCRECAYCLGDMNEDNAGRCMAHHMWCDLDGYCHKGKMRDGDEDDG